MSSPVDLTSDDYYKNLGISSSATEKDIKFAYRKLAIKHHPDKCRHDPVAAEHNFKIINEAYTVLSDPKKRQTYDMFGKTAVLENDMMEPMTKERAIEIFNAFFRFGAEFNPEEPSASKGWQRAAGGAVYAPAKGLLYGGQSVLTGAVIGTVSVVAGASMMLGQMALGVQEMGQATRDSARDSVRLRRQKSSGVQVLETTQQQQREDDHDTDHRTKEDTEEKIASSSSSVAKTPPSFLAGLHRATIGAIGAPVAGLVAGGSVLLASGVAAGGYVVGGLAGSVSNIKSGVKEIQLAKEHEQRKSLLGAATGAREPAPRPV